MNVKSLTIFFIVAFIVVFLVYYLFVCRPRLKRIFEGESKKKNSIRKTRAKSKKVEVGELTYLESKFDLKRDKLNWKSLAFWISVIDAFIISFVVFIIELIKIALIIKLVIAFILLFALIYSLYEIYGRILKNKQEKED